MGKTFDFCQVDIQYGLFRLKKNVFLPQLIPQLQKCFPRGEVPINFFEEEGGKIACRNILEGGKVPGVFDPNSVKFCSKSAKFSP